MRGVIVVVVVRDVVVCDFLLGLLVLRPSISSLLQSATVYFITKSDSFFITKSDKCYYKVRQVLQSATEQTVAALEIFAAHHYNMVTKIIPLFISPLNSRHNF